MAATDPTASSRWRPLHRLLAAMDDDIAQIYKDLGVSDLKPTWVRELLRLEAGGPMTITELAESTQRTHSAMSQKVSAMQAAGFVRTRPGPTPAASRSRSPPRHAGSPASSRPNGRRPRPRLPSSRQSSPIRSAGRSSISKPRSNTRASASGYSNTSTT